MGLFDLFARRPALSEGLEQYRNTPGAILLDVRTPEEYRDGHLPGAKNLPLDRLDTIAEPSVHLLPQRGAERPGQSPAGAGGVFRHRSGGPAGLPRAAGSIGREAA